MRCFQFTGTWYEVQAYPKEQQTGQCVSHTYSEAGTDALRLISNQVLNQGLIQTNSDVRFSSAQDSSGKLTIIIRTNETGNQNTSLIDLLTSLLLNIRLAY